MNYIKKLESENEFLKNKILEISDIENDLRRYLSSSKFHGFENKFVNPDDIIRWLDTIRDSIPRLTDEV